MDIDKLEAGPELDAFVQEKVMGCPKRVIPDDCKDKYGEVKQESDLWREIMQKAIDAGVKLKIVSAYKGVSYAGEFDGWGLFFSIDYSDSYEASDEIVLDGKPEDWMDGWEPGISIYPAVAKPYSTDIAAAWEMEEEIAKHGLVALYVDALFDIVTKENGLTDLVNEITDFLMVHATPLQRCKAALKAVMENA